MILPLMMAKRAFFSIAMDVRTNELAGISDPAEAASGLPELPDGFQPIGQNGLRPPFNLKEDLFLISIAGFGGVGSSAHATRIIINATRKNAIFFIFSP